MRLTPDSACNDRPHENLPSGTDVLIVDGSEECREVLRTLLESRGVRTNEAAGAAEGLERIEQDHPQVVVLDTDDLTLDSRSENELRVLYQQLAERQDAAFVVLGEPGGFRQLLPPGRVVTKPYHYAPLIRTIEQLLQQ